MDFVPTTFALVDASTKWGLVTIAHADGTLVREFVIDGPEAAEVERQLIAGEILHPPGVTAKEWGLGNSTFSARPLLPGMARVAPDGTLILNYGRFFRGGKLQVRVLRLPARDFQIAGAILLLRSALAAHVEKLWQSR